MLPSSTRTRSRTKRRASTASIISRARTSTSRSFCSTCSPRCTASGRRHCQSHPRRRRLRMRRLHPRVMRGRQQATSKQRHRTTTSKGPHAIFTATEVGQCPGAIYTPVTNIPREGNRSVCSAIGGMLVSYVIIFLNRPSLRARPHPACRRPDRLEGRRGMAVMAIAVCTFVLWSRCSRCAQREASTRRTTFPCPCSRSKRGHLRHARHVLRCGEPAMLAVPEGVAGVYVESLTVRVLSSLEEVWRSCARSTARAGHLPQT